MSVRRWARLPALLALAVVALAVGWYLDQILLATVVGGPLLFLALWQWWLIPVQVRNHQWCELEEELVISSGKFWRTLSVIPYGRIQYVDVSQGPLERRYGLKALKLNTASPVGNTTIHGLDAELADALRERVAERAKVKMIDL